MLDELNRILEYLPIMLQDRSGWKSLVINRRKPYTYRAFYQFNDLRVCLHRFETCDEYEAFPHPHAWPAAFKILKGSYRMELRQAYDRFAAPEPTLDNPSATLILTAGSSYEMTNPYTFHTIQPLEECYTVMVNAPPWPEDAQHSEVRTTKGKDLDSMTEEELTAHFEVFKQLL